MHGRGLTAVIAVGVLLLVPSAAPSDKEAPVIAAGRGAPWINMRDGVAIAITPEQDGVSAGAALLGRPRALAQGDFDGDGVPDLVSAYGDTGAGVAILYRGNMHALYPNSAGARLRGGVTPVPFLAAASFPLPVAPDFMGTGDFDADGHVDLVVAGRGARAVFWLAGDGHGQLGAPLRIELPGTVTALATGDINSRDGLTDVAVGIAGPRGAQVLVFESPEGAFAGVPDALLLPAAANALAIGPVHDGAFGDLVIAAGRNLIIAEGRDRKPIDDAATIAAAVLTHRRLASPIAAIALGDFAGDGRPQIAVLLREGAIQVLGRPEGGATNVVAWPISDGGRLPGAAGPSAAMAAAKVSSRIGHALVVTDPAVTAIEIFSPAGQAGARLGIRGAPAAVLPMQLNGDAQSDLVVLAEGQAHPTVVTSAVVNTFVVTNNNDSGPGSLRQAITDANASPGTDGIDFQTSGPIEPITPLPPITEPVMIDGTTSPNERVELSGASGGATGLVLQAGGSLVRGLVINRFSGRGIRVSSNGNVIDGNLIGTNFDGTEDQRNSVGIEIRGVTGNLVGGTTVAARNVISGNATGLLVAGSAASGNLIQGNYIGTNITGSARLGNRRIGIRISGATGNTIGGTAAGSGNVISANADGVEIRSDATANLVQGNFIGTDATGSAALPNATGIDILNAPGNTIGGTTVSARNIITHNVTGVLVQQPSSTGNRVQGNWIGLGAPGTGVLGNDRGVFITSGASSNLVGGDTAGARNVISRNGSGVLVGGTQDLPPTTDNRVQGNFIGLDPAGTAAAGNRGSGVSIGGHGTRIGGRAAGTGNVISGNSFDGVRISGIGARVEGNRIGTNAAGTAAVPNRNGVTLSNDTAQSNVVGGTAAGAGNHISGNSQFGVWIIHSATDNAVHGNRIGTDAAGTAALPNGRDGIRISFGASRNEIGGELAAANTIAFNGGAGVTVLHGSGALAERNTIRRNSIFSNGALGIELASGTIDPTNPGVTPNDEGDADSGANHLQNFPSVFAVINVTNGTRIRGTLRSTPSMQFKLDFFASPVCDAANHGEGQRFLRSVTVTTDSSGVAAFTVVASPGAAAGEQITATATGPASGTSEFSRCREVPAP